MKKVSIFILLMLFSNTVFSAGLANCGTVSIQNLYVQGDRGGDNSFHANKMLVIMGPEKLAACDDFTFAYLENTDDAYESTLSMVLAAYMAGKKIRIQIENNPAQNASKRIAWVNF
ncbi:hypothetical protein FLL45_00385 [Aliikangiella marina]|uniref:Uncharacterized protein n=1 Tax=Aliikangiella marina TaxID=1712262 RepID=A0A545TGY6_9GAMM|nr:hypothetical protein [Aliikangiella marina]TQV76458.1 hypothetical protein FLL45_00385 [Aliikangiella marina]